MKYYVAYGSNLNKEQMKYRCPHAKPIGIAVIEDYELKFRGHSQGVLTIEPKEGSHVPVGIWLITESCEHALDRYEGYPSLYRKETIKIKLDDGEVDAIVYIMNERYEIASPSMYYLNSVLKGYKDFGFNQEIVVNAIPK